VDDGFVDDDVLLTRGDVGVGLVGFAGVVVCHKP
jgi:hypothetical protein